jgi:hypothetical protein
MLYYKSIQVRFLFVLFCYFILIPTEVCGQHFTTIKSVEGIEILENGKKVLFYQVRPKSVDGKYERAGYIHPLYSLNEKILTDDMPADHPYHRGIFWAWHQIILNEKNIADGWISENISWKPMKVKVKKRKKRVLLQSEMVWNAELEHQKPTAIVSEKTKITVFKSTAQYRILDFDIQLFALADNLKIGGSNDEKGYGGFCLRLKLPNDLSFVSENKIVIPQETPVLAGPWMDFTGSFEGESLPKTGVVVFGYTARVGHQHPWILRKATSMQNIPYPGRTPIELSKKGLRLTCRIIVHNGEMRNEDIEKLYQQYIHNP